MRDQLSEYGDLFKDGWPTTLTDEQSEKVYAAVGCICTDVDFIRKMASCVFGDLVSESHNPVSVAAPPTNTEGLLFIVWKQQHRHVS